jgi:hypothetical protein
MGYLKGYRAFLLESGQQDDWMERFDPIRRITHMSKSRDLQSRSMAAEDPNCPPDILEKLSRDPDELVRASVARNKKTPVSVLNRLAGENNPFINKSILRNPHCPDRILSNIVMSGDITMSGLKRVVNHPNASVETLIKLSNSKRDLVAVDFAKEKLETMIRELEASGKVGEARRIQDMIMLGDFGVSIDPLDITDLGELDI